MRNTLLIHCIPHLCSRSESIKAGHSIVVIPGGLAEAILSSPTEPAILLKARYLKTNNKTNNNINTRRKILSNVLLLLVLLY